MKKLLLSAALTLATVVSYGQGAINFNNATGWWNPAQYDPARDYRLRFDATASWFDSRLTAGSLVCSNSGGVNLSGLRAELLYGASTITDISKLSEALPSGTAGYCTFRQSTSANPGAWFGSTRTFNGFTAGDTLSLGIIVWDVTKAADGLTAYAGRGVTYDGLLGWSSVFQYTCPTGNPSPTAYLPQFTPFTVGMIMAPEPSTVALVGLGAAALLLRRWRKC